MNGLELRYERRDLRGRDRMGRFLEGPPLPSWWPRPAKRILLDAGARRTAVEPWHKVGLGPGRLVIQIATRWP